MKNDTKITGQVFLRNAGRKAPDGSKRKLMMVVGVIAVPEEYHLKPEHQYTVIGEDAPDLMMTSLVVMGMTGIDKGKELSGYDAGQILCSPIWRV